MRRTILLLTVAACFAIPAKLSLELDDGIEATKIQIVDGGDTLYTINVERGSRGFFLDIPEDIPERAEVLLSFDEGLDMDPLLRGLDIFETEDVGLNIGYPGEHVELTGDYIDVSDKEIKNVATPTSSGSTSGNAVSTAYMLGPVKSNSTSYKLYSK